MNNATVIDATNVFQLDMPSRRSDTGGTSRRPSHFLNVLLELARHKSNAVSSVAAAELNVLFNRNLSIPDHEKALIRDAIVLHQSSAGENEISDEETGGMHP